MTCSFAMLVREIRDLRCVDRSTRVSLSQTNDGGGRAKHPSPRPRWLRPELGIRSLRRQIRRPRRLVDLFRPPRPTGRTRGRRLRRVAVAVTVRAVREGQRWLHLELALEAGAAFLPAFLVLELVLVQRGRLLDPVRVAELDGQLRGGAPHLVPRRAERELIRDGADAPRVDVAR